MKALQDENETIKTRLDEMEKEHGSMQDLINQLKKQKEQAQKRLDLIKDMLARFKSLIEAGKLKVKIRRGKMVLVLPSAVLFKPGKANLSKSGEETLSQIAPVLASIEGREFQIAGHTDNQPIEKSEFPSNWMLSVARALSVVEFLQSKGVSPESLSAAGYSEYQPVVKNVETKGHAANRRIEIIVMPNLDELPSLNNIEEVLGKEEEDKK